MRDEDYTKLLDDTQRELLAGAVPAAVLGLTPVALRLLASLAPAGLDRAVNAARLGLRGVVAEFGMFKGGTTMFLSRVIERLGTGWPVIGFDTFGGFPPRRSPLDMYDHPDCVFTDMAAVQRDFDGRDIEIIAGDIEGTCRRLEGESLVLAFIDTDNHTPAAAALEVVRQRTVAGGAIVFDHFTGTDRFRYTLGERIAGRAMLDDPRWFHLHGTGVFYRQETGR